MSRIVGGKTAENSSDRVKIKKGKILVYTEVHEFFPFAIFALDELVIRSFYLKE